jgi:hypothetical protein
MFVSVPIVALGFPILDTLLAFVRRLANLRHPFVRDLDHIQHRLEQRGLSDRAVVLSLYALCILFSGAALTIHYLEATAAEFLAFFAFGAAITAVLFRLSYASSLWNSVSVASLRRVLTSAVGLRRHPSPPDSDEPKMPYEDRPLPASKRRPF